MVDPLDRLEAWAKKWRWAKLIAGPFAQPGESWYIELSDQRTGRHIALGACDEAFATDPDDPAPYEATVGELVAEALRRWDVLEASGGLTWPDPA